MIMMQPRHSFNFQVDDTIDAVSLPVPVITTRSVVTNRAGSGAIAGMESELQRLLVENMDIKRKLLSENSKFGQDFFKADNEKVRYYTGIPKYDTFKTLYG